MRILFGVLGLLVVASIVFNIAQKQLKALSSLPTTPVVSGSEPEPASPPSGERGGRLDAFPGAVAADPGGLTVPQQSQNLQNKVSNDVNRLMQQGAARSEGQ